MAMEKELEKKTLAGILKDAKANWKEAGAWFLGMRLQEIESFSVSFFCGQDVIIDITIRINIM